LFSQIGPLELVIVLVIVLLIFGPKRLPHLGRQLGSGMREFKDSITGDGRQREHDDDASDPAALPEGGTQPPPAAHAERSSADAAHDSQR
jgi:sec-independent protein translocase protein TatA